MRFNKIERYGYAIVKYKYSNVLVCSECDCTFETRVFCGLEIGDECDWHYVDGYGLKSVCCPDCGARLKVIERGYV